MWKIVTLQLFNATTVKYFAIKPPLIRGWKRNMSAFAPQNFVRSKRKEQEEPNQTNDDPETFGTLSPSSFTPFMEEKLVDPLDIKEEKFLHSVKPLDRKSARKYGEEMKLLIQKGQLTKALEVYDTVLPQDNVKPDVHVYGVLIGGCGRAGNAKQAFKLYNQMKKRNLEPPEGVYTALFNACANSRRLEDGLQRAQKLRKQLVDKGKFFNKFQYHAMIKAFGRCGDLQTAFQVVDEMVSNSKNPNAETFSFLLQSCISDPKEGFKLALNVWHKMRKFKIYPDLFLYNLMLRSVRDCGLGEELEKESLGLLGPKEPTLLLESLALTLPKDSRLKTEGKVEILPECTSVINLLDATPQLRGPLEVEDLSQASNRLKLVGGAVGFLRAMKRDKVDPDIKTFTQLLEIIQSDSIAEVNLMMLMKANNVKPDIDFFNLLIKKRNYRQDFEGAKSLLVAVQEHTLYPSVVTFGVLALGCGTWAECCELLETMDKAGFRINVPILGSLLKNAVVRKDCWYLNELLQKAADLKLSLDPSGIKLLENFREKMQSDLAKQDRGQLVSGRLKDPNLREGFRIFCLSYKRWLGELPLEQEY